MKKNKDKIVSICYLVASICFYISAIGADDSNWVINLCLGSAFLCLAAAYLHKDGDKNDK